MTTKQSPQAARIGLSIIELSATSAKLTTALHRVRTVCKDDLDDVQRVDEAMDALEAVTTLRKYLKDKYPQPEVKLR